MVFTRIRNVGRLYETVANCDGSVFYRDSDGVLRDMKPLARQLLSMRNVIITNGVSRLEVIADEKRDRDRLIQLMFGDNAS